MRCKVLFRILRLFAYNIVGRVPVSDTLERLVCGPEVVETVRIATLVDIDVSPYIPTRLRVDIATPGTRRYFKWKSNISARKVLE